MPPKTRSGGVPPPSRVYHSTPAQQQAQFPPRRKIMRTYGKQNKRKQAETSARAMRQQTLTQIDFVSSFEAEQDPIVLSDSEEDELHSEEEGPIEDSNKENQDEIEDHETTTKKREDEDEEPVSTGRKRRVASSKKATAKSERTKRRRTLGDDAEKGSNAGKERKSNRRKTTGDAPSSSYHTQTLTQFLGRDAAHAHYIKDSEDEDEDEGFQQWLGDPTSPSPQRIQDQKPISPVRKRPLKSALKSHQRPQEAAASREESVVPQTPRKRAKSVEIPSSSQASAPPSMSSVASLMLNRYGPPDRADPSPVKPKSSSTVVKSPLKQLTGQPRTATTPRRHDRIIQDSYHTESWGSVTRTPLRELPVDSPNRTPKGTLEPFESSSALDEMETPTKSRPKPESSELGGSQRRILDGSPTPRMKRVSPGGGKKKVLLEIPDSEDEDDEDFDDENEEGSFVAGPETQFVMNEIASSEESAKITPAPGAPLIGGTQQTALGDISSAVSDGSHLQPSTSSPPLPPLSSRPTTNPPASASTPKRSRRLAKRLRKPIHRPVPPTQTQPLESQRVPLATLQSLPPASARTDVLLPLPEDTLTDIIEGFQVDLLLPFKIPAQVVRFWFYEGDLLQFLACAEPGRVTDGPAWRYHLSQVYELNNPVEGDDMREEGWVEGDIGRYVYIPPAVVGQLLWNLRHPIFSEDGDGGAESQVAATEDGDDGSESGRVNLFAKSSQQRNPTPTPSMSVSQQVEAQLKSDIAHSTQFPHSDDILVPSTPEEENDENSSSKQDATPPTTHVPSSPKTIKPPPRTGTRTPFAASSYRAIRSPLSSSTSRRPTTTVRPSQATTVSQASTPEKQSSSSIQRPSLHSSSSIGFPEGLLDDEDGVSSPPLRLPPGYVPGSSQLLTKSQMLPDSLVIDDARLPPEIWDSEDEGDDNRL